MIYKIEGAGGKGNSARQSVEADNTLSSDTIIHSLEYLAEGEIVGFPGGYKDAFINNIPIQNEDGSFNFSGITIDYRTGLPDQTAIPGFEEVYSVFPSNSPVTHEDTPTGMVEGSVTHSILGTNIQSVILTIALTSGMAKLDKETGDLNKYSVNYKFYVKQTAPTVLTEVEVLDFTLEGKTISAYEKDHRIDAPAGATVWQFRVERVSIDDANVTEKSEISLSRWTEITTPDTALTYPNSALAGWHIPAKEVGNQIPARGHLPTGLICQIPSNYDPVAKTYSGNWDGNFITGWTDNNAWCLYSVIVNKRFGIGEFLKQDIIVDKFDFYDAGVYCDELVPDGLGGQRNRFTCNVVIRQQKVAWDILQLLASSMRAIVVDNGTNSIGLIQDRPTETSKILTNANVLGGLFTYSSVSIEERPTVCNVTFNDKEDKNLPRTISEPEEGDVIGAEFIDKYGFNQADLAAYACDTEAQARTFAKWVLYTANYEYTNISFSLGMNVIGVQLGSVVAIMDNDRITADNTTFLGGRVKSAIGTTVILDRPVNLDEAGYTFSVMAVDQTAILERNILNQGTTDTLTLDTALPVETDEYYLQDCFCFKTGLIEPVLFKVLAIRQTDEEEYNITGSFYDPQKWGVVEEGLALVPYNYVIQRPLDIMTGLSVEEDGRNDDNIATNILRLYWNYNPKHLSYEIEIVGPTGDKRFYPTSELFLEFKDVPVGLYKIQARAVGLSRTLSPIVNFEYTYGLGTSPLFPPINLEVEGGGAEFADDRVTVTWEYNPANEDFLGMLKDYRVALYDSAGVTFITEYSIPYEIVNTSSFYKGAVVTYLKEKIISDFGKAERAFEVRVRSRDLLGRTSTAITLVISNPAPAVPVGTVDIAGQDITVTLDPASLIPDLANLIISIDTVSGFNQKDRKKWLDKVEAHRAIAGIKYPNVEVGTLYARFALDDSYSDLSLNWSTEQTIEVTVTNEDLNMLAPSTPTGLAINKIPSFSKEGAMTLTIEVTWNEVVEKYTIYTLSYNLLGDSVTSYMDVSEPLIIVSGVVPDDSTYELAIRASNGDKHSDFSTPKVTVVFDKDVTDPAAPSALQATHAPGISTLIWTNPTDLDFKVTHIYASTTDDRTTAIYLGFVAGNTMSFTNLESGVTWYLWLQAEDFSSNVSPFYPSDTTGWSTTTGGSLTYETPDVPTNLQVGEELVIASDGTSLVNLDLTWDAVAPPVTSYLMRVTTIDTGEINIGEFPTNSWKIRGAVAGYTYKGEVAAKYLSSVSAYGTPVTILVDGVVDGPSAPSALTYISVLGSVTLSWTNPPEDDFSYTELKWSDVDDVTTSIVLAKVATDTYTFNDTVEGSVHYFWLQSFNRSKAGSDVYPALTDVPNSIEIIAGNNYIYLTPDIPTNLAISEIVSTRPSGMNVVTATVSWDAVASAVTGYNLYIEDTDTLELWVVYTEDTKIVFSDLIKGKEYNLKIKAENQTTSSAYSSILVTTIIGDIVPPALPTGLAYTENFQSVTITWINPVDSDFKDTLVYYNSVDTFIGSALIGEYSFPEAVFSNINPGDLGYIWLKARDTDLNVSGETASLLIVAGDTLDIARQKLLQFPLPDASSGSVTPNFDTQANSFKLTITGATVTIEAPTATLGANESIEGFFHILDGLANSAVWGTSWNWGGAGAPTFTNDLLIKYRRVSGDTTVKAWLIGGF